jgi:glycosyltransferase involved in cell wall biosynthesis
MAEVIETHKVGSIYNPGDSEALAKIILELYHNPERTHQMGSHARELALEMFSDEIFKKKLLSSI